MLKTKDDQIGETKFTYQAATSLHNSADRITTKELDHNKYKKVFIANADLKNGYWL